MVKVNDNDTNREALSIYLKEISKFPLLTEQEEKKYGSNLKLINGSHIVKKVDKTTTIIDIYKVFKCLTNIKEYKKVLNILKQILKNNKSDNDYNMICKYEEIAELLERPLNEHEFFVYFNVELPKGKIDLSYEELILEIENYLKYSDAKKKFMDSNLRLVVSIAKPYNLSNFDFLEIINEGNMGLLKSIDKFDVDRNTKFSTYSVYWIKQSIINYISINNGIVTLSRHVHDDLMNFTKKYNKLKEETGRDYSAAELSKIFGIDYEIIVDYILYSEAGVSLDQPVKEEEDSTLIEFLPSDEPSVEEEVTSSVLTEEIEALLSNLSDNQQYVIKKRFGLTGRACTLDEVAKELNLTRERVRQIEARGLSKLRDITRKSSNNLRLYLK